jgi:hypothetical protein
MMTTFYIKPQQCEGMCHNASVAKYLLSTSNHNIRRNALHLLVEFALVDGEAMCQGYRLAFPENDGELDEWLMAEDEYRNW